MSIQRMELCGACAAKLKDEGLIVQKVRRGVDQKVSCEKCGKRRYGGPYDVDVYQKGDAKA